MLYYFRWKSENSITKNQKNNDCKNKIKAESEKNIFWYIITVNTRMILPEFSFLRTKQSVFWKNFK